MNVAFQIYASIAMAITTVCAVVAVAYWIDDVIVGRKKHNRLRGEIWSALRDTAHVYGEQGVIPSEVVLEVLHNLYYGKFIDWRQIKMDKEAMEWSVSGEYCPGRPSGLDIVGMAPTGVTRTVWMNVYPDAFSDRGHRSREEADRFAGPNRIACVEVSYSFEE